MKGEVHVVFCSDAVDVSESCFGFCFHSFKFIAAQRFSVFDLMGLPVLVLFTAEPCCRQEEGKGKKGTDYTRFPVTGSCGEERASRFRSQFHFFWTTVSVNSLGMPRMIIC